MKPVVDRLTQEYAGRMTFKLYPETDKDKAAAAFANKQGVSAVPTMMLVDASGKEIKRWVGAQSESELATEFETALATH